MHTGNIEYRNTFFNSLLQQSLYPGFTVAYLIQNISLLQVSIVVAQCSCSISSSSRHVVPEVVVIQQKCLSHRNSCRVVEVAVVVMLAHAFNERQIKIFMFLQDKTVEVFLLNQGIFLYFNTMITNQKKQLTTRLLISILCLLLFPSC